MKILQINNYNYLKGGSEKVYQVSIDLLKSKGHDVRYFSILNDRNEDHCEGHLVKITSWRDAKGVWGKLKGISDFIYNNKVAKELNDYIERFRPDVVHVHIFYGALSNAIIGVLRKHKIPIVQSVHEFRLLCPAYTCLDSSLSICELCANSIFKTSCVRKRCVKSNVTVSFVAALECFIRDRFFNYQESISAFIMVSQFIKDKHIKYYPTIAAKCHQVYNSVDIKAYAKYVINPKLKENYYLYLGRLSYEKGVDTLIDVFAECPNLNLKIAGTGPIEDELKYKVEKLGLQNIEFLGYINGDNLYKTIASAKYTMVPSQWFENNPLSIIESFALGTPVIGSIIGGIPELIDDAVDGYLHQINSKESILNKLEESNKLSIAAYSKQCESSLNKSIASFDNEIYYTKLIEIYNSVKNARR